MSIVYNITFLNLIRMLFIMENNIKDNLYTKQTIKFIILQHITLNSEMRINFTYKCNCQNISEVRVITYTFTINNLQIFINFILWNNISNNDNSFKGI